LKKLSGDYLVFGLGKKEKKELERPETPKFLSEIKSEVQKPPEEFGSLKTEVEKFPKEPVLPELEPQIEKTSELETKVEEAITEKTPKVSEPETLEVSEPVSEPKTEGKTDMLDLEELSQKIENENIKIKKKVKTFLKKSEELTLDSPEIINLIKLYEKASKKSREFVDKINKLEADGWKVDETVAAFYKFRIAKGLSSLKREESNIEKLCEKVGFTPSKIHEILEKPTEKLMEEFSKEASTLEELSL